MNISRVIVIMWAIVLPSVSYAFESVETVTTVLERVNALSGAESAKQQELLDAATSETKMIVAKAITIMDRARAILFADTTTKKEVTKVVKTIIKQNFIAAQAQQKLKRLYKRLMQENTIDDVQDGYVIQCIVSAQDFGKSLLAPFSYTKNEKNIAQQIVDGLTQQRAKIMQDYDALPLYTSRNKIQLKKYECAIMQLDAEIYRQQCITGEKMSFKKQAALLVGAAAATIAGVVLTHKFLLPEMFAVKPENVTVLDSQDESKNVDQVVDVISSELTIVEPEQLQEQASFPVEVAEENNENRDSYLGQQNTVEQATEELDTIEVPIQEQESILSNPPVEKGYWDTIKDTVQSCLGLGDSQETVEVVAVPKESTIVVENIETQALEVIELSAEVKEEPEAIKEIATEIESITVEESVTVKELEAKVSEVVIEIPVVVEVLEVIEPLVEVKEEAKEIIEVATVPEVLIITEELEVKELEIVVTPEEVQTEQVIIEPSEVIEVAVEEDTMFDSAIDLDGNPVMVIPSITRQKEYVAHDEVPRRVMSTQEEFVVEQEKLQALKDDYGWGYFGSTTLEEVEAQEKKVVEIAEVVKVIEDENSWNCLFAKQRDLEAVKLAEVRIQETQYGIRVLKQKIEKARNKNVKSYQDMLSVMEAELNELVEKKEELKNS